jgi:hypothetical protein
MSSPHFQLVRKGTELKDSLREMRVEINPPSPNVLLPVIFTRQKFVVPREDFLCPIDMEGKALHPRLRETDERVEVYPEFRLIGVEEGDGGKRLAIALYHGYDEQIPTLRELLDGIFRGFIRHHPTAEDLDRVAAQDRPAYGDLRREIAAKLGLKVEWSLQPEPRTAEWLRKLVEISPRARMITYNKELAATEFNLAFSLSVERASIPNLHRLQRRARQNLQPEEEFKRIFQRVEEMTKPAFRAVWTGLNVWNRELVRELAVDGFAKVVSDRLMKEMGYVVRFSDFVPEPSENAIRIMGEVSSQPRLVEDYKDAAKLLGDLKKLRTTTLLETEGNFEKVKGTDERIAQAEAEMTAARNNLLSGSQQDLEVLQAVKPGALEDLRQKFRAALLLEEKTTAEGRYGQPE